MQTHIKVLFSLDTILLFFLGILLFLCTFFIPPFQKADEPVHFFRVITIFTGQMSCTPGGKEPHFLLPKSVYEFPTLMAVENNAQYSMKFPISSYKKAYPWLADKQVTDQYVHCKLPVYAYIPQILVIFLTYSFDNLLLTFFGMRLVNALLFFITVWIVQKRIAKTYKYIFWLFAFTPMVLHQVTAISYDAPSYILGMLMFAFFLHLLAKTKVSLKETVVFIFLIVFFNAVKGGYYPTFLLLLPIMLKKKIEMNRSVIAGSIVIVCVLGYVMFKEANILQLQSIFSYSSLFYGRQIILQNPLYFFQASIVMLMEDANQLIHGGIGQFGWLDYSISEYIYVAYIFLFGLIVAISAFDGKKSVHSWIIILYWGIILATGIGIFFLFYTKSTPPGYYKVISIQGRYFLPILPLIGIAFIETCMYMRDHQRVKKIAISIFLLCVVISLGRSVFLRYFDYSKFIINYNPLIESIHNGTLDIEGRTESVIDSQKEFIVPVDRALGNKISGFQFVPVNETTVNVPYEFFIKDENCARILARGYLDHLRGRFLAHIRFSDDPVYTQFFPAIPVVQNSVCIALRPLTVVAAGENEVLRMYNNEDNNPILRILTVIQ